MTNPTDLKRQGNRLLAERAYAKAEDVFRELIQTDPAAPDGYVGLAKIFDAHDRIEEIVQTLEPIAEVNSPQVLKRLANAYRMLAFRGRTDVVDRAIAVHRQYLNVRSDPVGWFYLGDLLFELKKNYADALVAYRHAWEADPVDEEAYKRVVAAAKKLGRLDEIRSAEAQWRDAVRARGSG